MSDLQKKYDTTGDICCVCGMALLTTGDPLGDYFVMDKNGKFYCTNCDCIFEEGDKRIYIKEE